MMRTAGGFLCILLGLLLLVPALAVVAWMSRQYVFGFDETFQIGLIVLSLLGLSSVVVGTLRVVRCWRRQPH